MEYREILDALESRYAVKQFDPKGKLSADQIELAKETLRLTPSSFGVQPWRFIFVSDPQMKNKLREHSFNQSQSSDCDTLVVMCRWESCTAKDVARYIDSMAVTRGVARETVAGLESVITNFVQAMTEEQAAWWMEQQVFIALGNLLTVCAQSGIDTCPMGGFVKERVDEALGLKEKGLRSVVLCALGKRSSEDKYARMAKVRFPAEEVILTV